MSILFTLLQLHRLTCVHYFHSSDSNLLCVTLRACSSISEHTARYLTGGCDLTSHSTIYLLLLRRCFLVSPPPPLLFFSKTILHSIMTPKPLCFTLSISLLIPTGTTNTVHSYWQSSVKNKNSNKNK